MTTEQQRIAIAEACEKTPVHLYPIGTYPIHLADCLPDYLNDLNAMHEAEKILTDDQHITYRNILANVIGDVTFFCRKYTSATAAQRAEAFLRTLNLWK